LRFTIATDGRLRIHAALVALFATHDKTAVAVGDNDP
jgi:hypothetical protein